MNVLAELADTLPIVKMRLSQRHFLHDGLRATATISPADRVEGHFKRNSAFEP